MTRFRMALLAAAASIPALAAPAQAQSWRPIERQCAHVIIQEYRASGHHCASCDGLWPDFAMCTIHYAFNDRWPQAKVKACITAANKERAGNAPNVWIKYLSLSSAWA